MTKAPEQHRGPFSVELANVSKQYQLGKDQTVDALNGVTLRIAAGESVALMGPSGSGKSTLLHVVGAMDTTDSGSIQVGPFKVSALTRKERVEYRRTIGFVFQKFHLLPALSVIDNVITPVLPYRSNFDKEASAQELLQAVGLEDRSHSVPFRLSGGQQQRVAIARALMNQPGLLLADEPTGNLDSDTGRGIVNLLLELRVPKGMTLIIATHDSSVAASCERIIRLQDGCVVDDTRPPDPHANFKRTNSG